MEHKALALDGPYPAHQALWSHRSLLQFKRALADMDPAEGMVTACSLFVV